MDELSPATAVDLERRFDLEPGTLGTALTCMLAAMPAGLCIQDTGGHYRFINHQMAELFERPVAKLINGRHEDWLDPAEVDELRVAELTASSRSVVSTNLHSLRIGGQRRSFVVTRRLLPNVDKTAPVWLCSIWRHDDGGRSGHDAAVPLTAGAVPDLAVKVDATAPGVVARHVSTQASIGRTLFNDQLRREHDLSNREHREFALVSIAVDRQPQSPQAQDESVDRQLVQCVEGLLRGNIRAMDSSFRVATNLFFMILSGVGLATAHSRVEALRRQCISESAAFGDNAQRLTLSIGVASFPHTNRDREEIVRAAETALDVAQRRGGNQVALARITFESG